MKLNSIPLLISVLRSPGSICELGLAEWDLLIRQAKAANLLAHLAAVFLRYSLNDRIPSAPLLHLKSALMISDRNKAAVKWEISQLREALYDLAIPIVVLKGAAYAIADLPVHRGRLFQDIDILVPRAVLADVEEILLAWRWRTMHTSHYDQHYYRTWMHEIPPLKHLERETVLDIHHSILPLTARLKPDPVKLISNAVNQGESDDIYWLQPYDMILHSATHLFHDGELENGLRDLVDLKGLIECFSREDGFWSGLLARAIEMELARPLYYAIRYLELQLQFSIPKDVKAELQIAGPRFGVVLMDYLFCRGLVPSHKSCDTLGSDFSRWLLYIRSHYLRMPMKLLLPHLIRKAFTNKNAELPKGVQRFVDTNRRL